jgi:hypothetical protein
MLMRVLLEFLAVGIIFASWAVGLLCLWIMLGDVLCIRRRNRVKLLARWLANRRA